MGRTRESMLGEKNPSWKGGVIKSHGYVLLYKPEHPNADSHGYVRRSAFIMSEQFQRPLAPKEIVHHINGKIDDDRPENLSVMTQAEHVVLHHKGAKWAEPLTCDYCGKQYYTTHSKHRSKRHFCSRVCQGKASRKNPPHIKVH